MAVSKDIWGDVLAQVGIFVCNPIQKSCVDEKISSLQHKMAGIKTVCRRKEVKDQLEKYDGSGFSFPQTVDIVKHCNTFTMCEAVCCDKEEHPDMHIDKKKPCPKFIPLTCTHGDGSKDLRS